MAIAATVASAALVMTGKLTPGMAEIATETLGSWNLAAVGIMVITEYLNLCIAVTMTATTDHLNPRSAATANVTTDNQNRATAVIVNVTTDNLSQAFAAMVTGTTSHLNAVIARVVGTGVILAAPAEAGESSAAGAGKGDEALAPEQPCAGTPRPSRRLAEDRQRQTAEAQAIARHHRGRGRLPRQRPTRRKR